MDFGQGRCLAPQRKLVAPLPVYAANLAMPGYLPKGAGQYIHSTLRAQRNVTIRMYRERCTRTLVTRGLDLGFISAVRTDTGGS
jgi:hypothetical protein